MLGMTRTDILGHGERPTGAVIMVVAVLFSFLAAPFVFSLQATNLLWWSRLHFMQPAVSVAIVAGLAFAGRLTLVSALSAVTLSIATQTGLAWWLSRRARNGQVAQEAGPT